ncbi:MAG: LysE family translocator [Ahrensia sp.]|nr:LysE family translocator [Ahrensia sp.]
MTLEFFITSLIVVLLPGTGVIYTLAIGLGRGFKTAIIAAFGCTLGIVPSVIASVIGLAALLHASALAFNIVKYLGVLYLLYMAWNILRDGIMMALEAERKPISNWKIIRDAIALNALNPKLSVFFLAFLPQFIAVDAVNPTVSMLSLAGIFMLMTFLVFIVYGGLASLVRDYVISRPSVMIWLKRSFAGAFALLGLRLALSER